MNATIGPLVLAIPTFNSKQFLARTLESVNANGPAVRWWLQDGASTDRTLEIARSFARVDDTIVSEPDVAQTGRPTDSYWTRSTQLPCCRGTLLSGRNKPWSVNSEDRTLGDSAKGLSSHLVLFLL